MLVAAHAAAHISQVRQVQLQTLLSCATVGFIVLSGVLGPVETTACILAAVIVRILISWQKSSRYTPLPVHKAMREAQRVKPALEHFGTTESDSEIPQQDSVKHFAYIDPATSKDEITDTENTDDTDTFVIVRTDDTAANKWAGPSSASLLDNPAISVFVTTDGDIPEIDQSISLFLARAGSTAEATAANIEKQVHLGLEKTPDSSTVLFGQWGEDKVTVEYPSHPGLRTHYMMRDNNNLIVGYFDTYYESLAQQGQVESKDTIVNSSSAAAVINADSQPVRIMSVLIYGASVSEDFSKVKLFLQEHNMKMGNSVYSGLANEHMAMMQSASEAKSTPPFEGVNQACADVKDWTQFDPVTASTSCRDAIKESCQQNSKQAGCECWDEEFAHFDMPVCQGLRLVYGDPITRVAEKQEVTPAQQLMFSSEAPLQAAPQEFIDPPPALAFMIPF